MQIIIKNKNKFTRFIKENDKKAKESLIQSEIPHQSIDELNQKLEQMQSFEDIDVMVESKKNTVQSVLSDIAYVLFAFATCRLCY